MPPDTPYSQLSNRKLEEAAREEAEAFELPGNWREGRTVRQGYAIDARGALDRDDAVSVTRFDNGESTLHVSIVDIGSFSSEMVAVTALAQRLLYSRYNRHRASRPMIPRRLSEEKFSFLHEQERPAVTLHIPVDAQGAPGNLSITREIMYASNISPAEIERIPDLDSNESITPIHDLGYVARLLFMHRHGGDSRFALEDEEGKALASQEFNKGQFIVRECMILANIAIGQFFADHEITVLYRRHDIPAKIQMQLGGRRLPRGLAAHFARADYTLSPSRHFGLKAQNVAHFTSPLRRFVDFANHRNLIAVHFDGREPPFDAKALEHVAWRHLQYTEDTYEQSLPTRSGVIDSRTARESLQNGSMRHNDLATIFFGTIYGPPEDAAALRQEAFAALIDKKALAKNIIDIAIQKKWLRKKGMKGNTFLIDETGNRIPYGITRKDSDIGVINKSLMVLSVQAGVAMEYGEIQELTRRSRILHDGRTFMISLSHKLRTSFNEVIAEDKERAEFTCTVSMRIRDTLHSRKATATEAREARRQAIGLFISELDLLDNPPEPPSSEWHDKRRQARELQDAIKQNSRLHPVVVVKAYADKRQIRPLYSFDINADNADRTQIVCRLKLVDTDETEYEVSQVGNSKTDAKLFAAAELAALLKLNNAATTKRKPQ